MDKTFDLISIGDATIDIFLKIHDLDEHCRLDKEKNELCVRYSEKILIDNSQFMLGGNACNVAVGTSRLSISTSFITELGDDEFSEQIIKGLKKEKIDTSLVKQTPDTQANFAIVITFQDDRTIFVRHIPRDHNFTLEGISPKWVFLTSIGKEWKKAYTNVLNFVQRNNIKLAFNPGTPQMSEGVETFIEIIRACEILFVNKTEAEEIASVAEVGNNPSLRSPRQLDNSSNASVPPSRHSAGLGIRPAERGLVKSVSRVEAPRDEVSSLLLQLKNLGPKIVVITDGINGSYLIDENGKMFKMGIFKCNVVQKTGAGDAYTSGFLSAVILGVPLGEAMRWGAINSAAVIQKTGAQIRLLRREEVSRELEENKDLQAEEI